MVMVVVVLDNKISTISQDDRNPVIIWPNLLMNALIRKLGSCSSCRCCLLGMMKIILMLLLVKRIHQISLENMSSTTSQTPGLDSTSLMVTMMIKPIPRIGDNDGEDADE